MNLISSLRLESHLSGKDMVYLNSYHPELILLVDVDGLTIELTIWDTEGDGHYDRLRPLSYPDSNIILICFAIDSPTSFSNVEEQVGPYQSFILLLLTRLQTVALVD